MSLLNIGKKTSSPWTKKLRGNHDNHNSVMEIDPKTLCIVLNLKTDLMINNILVIIAVEYCKENILSLDKEAKG